MSISGVKSIADQLEEGESTVLAAFVWMPWREPSSRADVYLSREGFAAAQQGESTMEMVKHEHEPR